MLRHVGAQDATVWVETGKAPDHIVASNIPRAPAQGGLPGSAAAPGKATRTYLICPWPKRSVFSGGLANPQKLDVNNARNWRCES